MADSTYDLSLPGATIDTDLQWLNTNKSDILLKTDLATGTGSSELTAMTQKAVTDALAGKASTTDVESKASTAYVDQGLAAKADRDTDAVSGNVAMFDNNGTPVDSGMAKNDVQTKVSGATPGNFAELDADGKVVDSGVKPSDFAKVGDITLADGLIDTISAGTDQEFLYRKSGGDGVAFYKGIKGKSIVWNQMCDTSAESKSQSGVTITNNGDGSYTIDGENTSEDSVSLFISPSFPVRTGEKYLIKGGQSSALRVGGYQNGVLGSLTTADAIVTATGTNADKIAIVVSAGWSGSNVKIWPQCVNLTRIYGSGNEPATVAQYEALYPGYRAYTPGIIKNNDADGIESVGFNQWDEDWEVGTINAQGGNAPSTTEIRSKNYIPIISGVTQLFFTPRKLGDLFCYDADKNFISTATYTSSTIGVICTLANNTAFVRFRTSAYGIVYLNDICVNISDPDRNGQYMPFWKKDIQLKLSAIKVKSHNIWDEEWEQGGYTSNGVKDPWPGALRCKNLIPCFSNTDYYWHVANLGHVGRVCFYDAEQNFLSTITAVTNTIFTTPNGAAYISFNTDSSYGGVYKHDICINKSDASFNGHYDPYGVDGVFEINGLDGVDSVFDLAKADMDGYVRGLDKKMDSYIIADSDVTDDGGAYTNVSYANVAKPRNYKGYNTYSFDPFLTQIFGLNGPNDGSWDSAGNIGRVLTSGAAANVLFGFAKGTTLAQMKTALVGTKVVYEMNTTIHYELAEPFFAGIMVDEDGTEKAIAPSAATTPSAPFVAQTTYSISIANLVRKIGSL